MAVDLGNRKRVSASLKSWLDAVATYEKTYKGWEGRSRKIISRYRDDKRDDREPYSDTRFNILWSNTQTLKNANFAKLPKPDVSRRFRDNDPVGRVASLILERALDYEVQHYTDYRATMSACVLDRFLPGRGTSWVRYEPKFRAAQIGQPEGGLQPTEDAETDEVLDYECAPCDYVHWADFGHSVARTWEEVGRVWRRIYMTKDALEERFGDKAKLIPMDASPQKDSGEDKIDEDVERAAVYEGWDKNTKKAYWFSKGVKDFLDEKDDPLHLEDFFPCPKPIYASTTNDSLIPIPDYCQYQDQANELDILSDRIDGLIRALQVKGVYDASQPALARLFKEGENGDLKPVKNWAAFAEKQGLKGSIDLADIKPIAEALLGAYQAFDQVKNQIYEITRISDIMRGFVDPDEKLGQSQLKTQYSNLGIKAYQDQVAQFAAELLQLKAQVMCNLFDPQTLLKLGAADQLSPQDQQLIPQAMQLLLGERAMNPEAQGANPLRSFRIEVQADSLIHLDEEQEKQSRVQFLEAQATFLKEFVAPLLAAPPPVMAALTPVMMETWKFGTTAFKVGKNIEGAFDEAAEKLKQLSAQPQPQGMPPEMMQKIQQEMQKKEEELKAQEQDLFKRETQHQVDKVALDAERAIYEEHKKADQVVFEEHKKVNDEKLKTTAERMSFGIQRETEQSKQAQKDAQQEGKKVEAQKTDAAEIEGRNKRMSELAESVLESNKELGQMVAKLVKVASADRDVVRDPKTGKVAGTRVRAT